MKFSMDALLPVRKNNCMSHFDTSLVTDHNYKKLSFLLYCNNSNFKKEEKQHEIFCAFPLSKKGNVGVAYIIS